MIVIEKAENKAEMSEGLVAGQFRIKESAKAFSILSSALYSNPIKAIVRELGCNARDSHVAAGNPEPFEVHLPTVMEPEFYVRDFGTGLSHEEVLNIYTTYFESTKTGSNDFVGALGLGSKSPFSYTENFSVTSTKNGVTSIYTAFINDSGVPSIVRMASSENASKPNGVEVRFGVKSGDMTRFAEEARSVFQFFDQLPICNLPIGQIKYTTEFGLKTFPASTKAGGVNVLMGGVCYPVDINRVPVLSALGAGLGVFAARVMFDAKIGEVEIQPSREGLTYTKKTIAFLEKAFADAKAEVEKEINSKMALAKNKWEEYTTILSIENSKSALVSSFARGMKPATSTFPERGSFYDETKMSLYTVGTFSYANVTSATKQSSIRNIVPIVDGYVLYNDTKISQQDIYEHMRSVGRYYLLLNTKKDKPDLKAIGEKFFSGKDILLVSSLAIKRNTKARAKRDQVYYSLVPSHKRGYYSAGHKWELQEGKSNAKYFIRADINSGARDVYDNDLLFKAFGVGLIYITKTSNYDTTGMIEFETAFGDLCKKYKGVTINTKKELGIPLLTFVKKNADDLQDKSLVDYVNNPETSEKDIHIMAFLQKYARFKPEIEQCKKLNIYRTVHSSLHYSNLPNKVVVDLFNSIFVN